MDVASNWQTTLLVGFSCCAIYFYGKWKQSTFYKTGIPGPKSIPFIGNLHTVMKKGHLQAVGCWLQKYGKVFGTHSGSRPVVYVTDLDMIKEITTTRFNQFYGRAKFDLMYGTIQEGLFFTKGEKWRRQRRIVVPAFSTMKLHRIRWFCRERPLESALCRFAISDCDLNVDVYIFYKMEGVINDCAENLTNKFLDMQGKDVKTVEFYSNFSLDMIIKVAYGIHSDSVEEILYHSKNLMPNAVAEAINYLFPFLGPIMRSLGISNMFPESYNFLVNLFNTMIHDRKAGAQKEIKDFLQLLVNAEDVNLIDGAKGQTSNKKLNQDEVIGQMLTFLVAGYATTSSALDYLSYCLAVHPHVQDRVVDEIREELQDDQPTLENINKLKYLDQVFNESLRLFPPIYFFNRRATETVTIHNVTIPKGSIVNFPVFHIHRDPAIYPDPETFNPERWAAAKDLHSMAYIPFGAGPRICVGMKLVKLEVKVAVVHLLRKIKFCKTAETKDKLDLTVGRVRLHPKTPIMLRIEKR